MFPVTAVVMPVDDMYAAISGGGRLSRGVRQYGRISARSREAMRALRRRSGAPREIVC